MRIRSNCKIKRHLLHTLAFTNLQQNTRIMHWSPLLINNVNYFYPFFTAKVSVFTITNFSLVRFRIQKAFFLMSAITLEWFPHNEFKSMSPCSLHFLLLFSWKHFMCFVVDTRRKKMQIKHLKNKSHARKWTRLLLFWHKENLFANFNMKDIVSAIVDSHTSYSY